VEQVIYVTGFEAFPGLDQNPAAPIVEAMNGTIVGPFRIVGEVVSSSFAAAAEEVQEAIKEHKPIFVLHLSTTLLDTVLRLESWAINEMSASTPDSEGFQPYNEAIDDEEEIHATYETDAPIDDIIAGIREQGVPARVSRNAGRFIENCLYYRTLDHLAGIRKNRPKALLIHLPLPGLRPFGDLDEPPWDMEQLALAAHATMKAIAACYAP